MEPRDGSRAGATSKMVRFVIIVNGFQSKYRKIRTRNNSVFGHFLRSGSAFRMLLLQAVFQPHVSLTRKLPTNCLSVFDHFVGLVLKVLKHFTSVKLAFRVQI